MIRYRATLDKFPVFGREGYVLPLGPVVQHTGELRAAAPLAALYLFGKPTQSLDGYTQARIVLGEERTTVAIAESMKVETFGDATGIRIELLT